MARLIALIAALALGMASAFALVSCGGGDAELLPGETADQIIENLDTVQTLADEGDCEGARRSAAEVSMQVDELSGVDRELVQALRRGTDQLETVVAQCEETTVTETVPETTTAETTDTTESERTGRTTTERRETTDRTATQPTTTQQTTPTTTPTPPTTPPTTPSPPSSGGSPSGGVTPGAAGDGQ